MTQPLDRSSAGDIAQAVSPQSSHVLPCRPSGITLDIKKSSFKKLSKWLQSKSSAGLILVKEDKHKKEFKLFSINRSHPDYASFKPEKRKVEKNEQTTDHSSSEGHFHNVLEVTEIYKPSVHVNPIFACVEADTGKFYSASESTDVVFRYIEQENLVKPTDKSVVVLDATLCDSLYKGTIKKGSTYPTEIHKKDIGLTFVNRMQAHHKVTRGSNSVVRKGSVKTIQLVTERRQGNKKVTKLSGLESFLLDAEALASELQKKFACSTSVAELPGIPS
ncbi:eukaryotic translation initiation factor SUI1 family protein [Actinidia rufa]|uniref:Eukaryotic translation initiation factor SUI1 family protein n=1 Tax=Actinidia rufa TaxID=165716 RepID=A0A7J0DPJ5_9ERIC|nr:eukaryotic translation initiation factor SUI1 family protein [Actinidia rufa]